MAPLADICQPPPAKPRRFQFTIFDMVVVLGLTVIGIEFLAPLIVERFENKYFHPIIPQYHLRLSINWVIIMIGVSISGAGVGVWRATRTKRTGKPRTLCVSAGVFFGWAMLIAAVTVPHWIPPRRMATSTLIGPSMCKGFSEAQEIYRRTERKDLNGDGVLEYARTIRELAAASYNGQPLLRKFEVAAEVNSPTAIPVSYFVSKLLTAQGPNAPNGQRNFIVVAENGKKHMTGYAFIVCPSIYGETGKLTYATSNAGIIYECDLGVGRVPSFTT